MCAWVCAAAHRDLMERCKLEVQNIELESQRAIQKHKGKRRAKQVEGGELDHSANPLEWIDVGYDSNSDASGSLPEDSPHDPANAGSSIDHSTDTGVSYKDEHSYCHIHR